MNNFTNEPAFIDSASGNFHLASNSPCINAGVNFNAPNLDMDGQPRIAGQQIDFGPYEYQNPLSVISYAWLQQFGLPTDGSADYLDTDGDGVNNWQEWRAGTDPTDPISFLKILSAVPTPAGVTVTWQSVTNRTYYLERATDFTTKPTFTVIQSISGQSGTTTYTDTTVTNGTLNFYRMEVQ